MGFSLPSDRAYKKAKRIRQGRARLDPRYDGFVTRFRERYGVAPLAVQPDAVRHPGEDEKVPRLGVVLERTDQYQSFLRPPSSFDPRKQQVVARMFVDEFPAADLRALFGLSGETADTHPWAERVFVAFWDFERVAKVELHDAVTAAELEPFTAMLGLDKFWCTQRAFGPPIIFVYTDEQASALRTSSLPDRWADAYFEIAKRHDEFGYLSRAEIVIEVDSKENFDNNFSSNWFYYFK